MLKIRKINSRGDTILEVLIAVSVLSLILVTSFVLANRSSQTNQKANERGEATKVAQTEIEKLKYYLSIPGRSEPGQNTFFCIENTASSQNIVPINTINLTNIDNPSFFGAIDNRCKTGVDGRYSIMVYRGQGTAQGNTYTAYVRWVGTGGNSIEKIGFVHRLYPEIDAEAPTGATGNIGGSLPVSIPVRITASADCFNFNGSPNDGCPTLRATVYWTNGSSPDTFECVVSARYYLSQTQVCNTTLNKLPGTTFSRISISMTTDEWQPPYVITGPGGTDRNLYVHSYNVAGQDYPFYSATIDPYNNCYAGAPGRYMVTNAMWHCGMGQLIYWPPDAPINPRINLVQTGCVPTDQFFNDGGVDYCQPAGTAWYLRRNGIIYYSTGSNLATNSYAKVVINYQQWPGTTAPTRYTNGQPWPGYNVEYQIGNAPKMYINLPPSAVARDYEALIPLPNTPSNSFNIQWTNNDGLDGDPDLQINSIQIYR